ncbi:unnamed protein product [Rotaria magnacalcarata]|uniref:Uncharacterized protein n=1 Tax=Rotaria magnacalcarata TaxID=392030 RepID=A0A8S3ILN1_9BILA|nr:unnamed protein product [Rotaria magnacalcarata]CAF5203278.1 unnamed protein product [Rotaria magnacalcarata]
MSNNQLINNFHHSGSSNDDDLLGWYPSQVKGPVDDEVQEADLISTIEFNEDGELLAVGDKGGRIVVFQRAQQVIIIIQFDKYQ